MADFGLYGENGKMEASRMGYIGLGFKGLGFRIQGVGFRDS